MEKENPDYLTEQLITCIGNKRALLGFLEQAVAHVKTRLGRDKLAVGDFFAGSGVVSRFMKQHASRLVSNDLELYAETIGRCYLSNQDELNVGEIRHAVKKMQESVLSDMTPGFISELYAPKDDLHIQKGERAFYTTRNALLLDSACRYISTQSNDLKPFLLGPLLSEASIHANTSGVFKGYHKNEEGIGCYGGRKGDALQRIKGDIEFKFPVWSNFSCPVEVCRGDANKVAEEKRGLDLVYLDPPYNQHPYGSNYFMLNLLAEYRRPEHISKISGIPRDWNRSGYNSRAKASGSLFELIDCCDASHVLVSYNSEGYVPHEEFLEFMKSRGNILVWEIDYNAYRGSRNLRSRTLKVKEYLYLLEKK